MKGIKRMKEMMMAGLEVITNPSYLDSPLSALSTEQIKATRKEKKQQFSGPAQRELSLRGNRTAFIEFHRFMFALSDDQIVKLSSAMKQFVSKQRLSEDNCIYCDQRILEDAIHYHMCIRFDKDFSVQIADEIARDFLQKCNLALNYTEVTSAFLITFAKNLIEEK